MLPGSCPRYTIPALTLNMQTQILLLLPIAFLLLPCLRLGSPCLDYVSYNALSDVIPMMTQRAQSEANPNCIMGDEGDSSGPLVCDGVVQDIISNGDRDG
ncbi:unnamed protein product [Lepidochelys olivacea]